MADGDTNTRPEEQPGPQPHQFDDMYAHGAPPWDIGRPQLPFVRLADADADGIRGRVLDVGCGTGEHALLAASKGFEVLGIDTSPAAILRAREKAGRRRLEARFEVWDALDLAGLGQQFDTVLDCGLFHVFDDDDRGRYVASLRSAVHPGGRFFLLCFSDRQPGDWGPRRVREEELRQSFADGWRVDSIVEERLEITFDPESVHAWFATITRV